MVLPRNFFSALNIIISDWNLTPSHVDVRIALAWVLFRVKQFLWVAQALSGAASASGHGLQPPCVLGKLIVHCSLFSNGQICFWRNVLKDSLGFWNSF